MLDESGLGRARPDAVIEFTFVDGYTQLAEIIKAHGYDLARRADTLPTPEQVGADWYDTVYRPGVDAIRRSGLLGAVRRLESHRRRSLSLGLQAPPRAARART
jgi:hypothetical protein